MRDAYVETIENFNGDMKNVLKNGFGMDVDDVYDFLNDSEGNTFDYVIQELRQVFRSSVNTNLLRKFNEGFKKDDDGKGRNWTEIEENSIKELHDGCKVRVEALLDEFKKIVFPKNVTRLDNIEEDTEEGDTPDGTFDLSRAVTSITEGAPKRTMSISNNRILSEEEVARVREKFYEDIDFVYEEAIARHVSHSTNLLNFASSMFLEKRFQQQRAHLVVGCSHLVRLRQHYRVVLVADPVLPSRAHHRSPFHGLPARPDAHPDGHRPARGAYQREHYPREDSSRNQNLTRPAFTVIINYIKIC